MVNKNSYKLIPIYTDDRKHRFVDTKLIPTQEIEHEGMVFHTSPLAATVSNDLIGISSNAESIERGVIDPTDKLSPDINLENIYIGFSSLDEKSTKIQEVLCIPINPSQHSLTKKYDSDNVIEYSIEQIVSIDTNTRSVDNAELCFLKDRCTHSIEVSFKVCLSFTVNTEIGTIYIISFNISTEYVKYLYPKISTAALNDLLNVINSGELIGYIVDAHTDVNRT